MANFPGQQPILNTEVKYAPNINNNQKIICQMAPAKYDAFVKLLNIMDVSSVINIQKGAINQAVSNGIAILKANVGDLIGEIDLQILNPKKYIKILKSIKGNNDVFIIDDEDFKRFIITNGEISAYLPKQIDNLVALDTDIDLSEITPSGKMLPIDKDTRNTIKGLIDSDVKHVDLLIYGGQVKGVSIPDRVVYTFSEYVGEKIDDTTAELKLKSLSFLSVDGEDYQLMLGEIAGKYWLGTSINTGFTSVTTLENVNIVRDDNLIV